MAKLFIAGFMALLASTSASAIEYRCGLLVGDDQKDPESTKTFRFSTTQSGARKPLTVDLKGYHIQANIEGPMDDQVVHFQLTDAKGAKASLLVDPSSFRFAQSLISADGGHAALNCRRSSSLVK